MNYWTRYVTRVAVRRVVGVLVLLVLAWAGIGRAEAQACPSGGTCSRAQAYAACMAVDLSGVSNQPVTNKKCETGSGPQAVAGGYELTYIGNGMGPFHGGETYWTTGCPSGTEWNDATKACFNRDRCLDKSSPGRGLIGAVANAGCIDGCQYGPKFGDSTVSFDGTKFVTITKAWTPTGEACTADNPIPDMDVPQICTPSGAGQTACVKQDGKMCYSKGGGVASQFCWDPGETGEKTDGPDKQVTNAGDQPIPPSLNLPNGDTLVPVGTPTTTTVNNNGKTTTTTTNNYNTQHGTDAGKGPGQAEPGDGTGKPEGDGEGDGKGTATGGDCSGGWACAGDPIACAQLRESNQARCSLEKGPGEGEGAGAEEGMGDGIGSLFGNGEGGTGRNVLDVLGGSIGQSKGCPPNPVIPLGTWGTIELPLDKICPHLQLMGTLMLGFAYLFAVKIMME